MCPNSTSRSGFGPIPATMPIFSQIGDGHVTSGPYLVHFLVLPLLILSLNRYYFGNLKLTLNQVRLSVLKSNKLSAELQAVKRKLNLSLITFEDANIELGCVH